MNILMASSEVNPFAKSGGLADVIYALSHELVSTGHNAIVVMPLYKRIKAKFFKDFEFVGSFYVDMSWRHQFVGLYKTLLDGITYYFIENEYYFDRDNLYGYGDDVERFAYFDLAVCGLIQYLDLKLDVVHVHDHQAAMIPVLLKYLYKNNVKTVLTIHNPAFQGLFDKSLLYDYFNLEDKYLDLVDFNYQASCLKAAIMTVDKITTVSPNHRDELASGMYDYGLSKVLKFRLDDFVGIVNGLDYGEFDPRKDHLISHNFSPSKTEGKEDNKKEFCSEYGFDSNKPLYGLVSRLTNQKGIELLLNSLPYYLDRINVFILGSGDYYLEQRVKELCNRFPNSIKSFIGYSDPLAHKVYAASDFFLMPSYYEPCGIGQMIAHRYGAIPIVRTTGGLKDTVICDKDGISFDQFDAFAMNWALDRSLEAYYNKEWFNYMRVNSMKKNHSWKNSCKKYVELYK